ncbi:MAG: sulfite exporter TauE/SafE family protein [Alphaproteobacteria bacterium]
MAIDLSFVILALVAFLAGGFVKGTVGIGLPTVSLAILSTGMDLRAAVALMSLPAACTNLYQATQGGEFMGLLRRHWPLALSSFIAVWFGTLILFSVDPLLLTGILGVTLCLYAVLALLTVPVRVPRHWEPVLGPLTGALTGVMTGATGSLALPLMAYLDGLGLDKNRFVQLTGIVASALTVPLAIGVAGRSMLAGTLSTAAVFVLVPAFTGLWFGQRVRARLSDDRFRTLVLLSLLVLGAKLVDKGFLGDIL